jgi:hypothetical protein
MEKQIRKRKYILDRTANATIANLQPFFYLLAAFINSQRLLDIHG